jgi:hypothetical protein
MLICDLNTELGFKGLFFIKVFRKMVQYGKERWERISARPSL